MGVLIFHLGPLAAASPPLGVAGVQLFFVLSGYLITTILLVAKEEGVDNATLARRFYIRRFLRIFPVYYLLLFVTALVPVIEIREGLPWYATFTGNFYLVAHGDK